MLVNELPELLLPNPAYLIAILALLAVLGFGGSSRWLRRLRFPLAFLAVWSYACATPRVANRLIHGLEDRYPEARPTADPAALVLVLSSGTFQRQGERWVASLDLAGWERTMAAVALWRQTGGELLFAGQPTPDGASSAADQMAEVAAAAGVPRGAIRVERRSRTTHENLLLSRELLAARDGHVWLVTSALHMPRAMAVASRLDLRVHPAPCGRRGIELQHWYSWLPHLGGPEMTAAALHEYVGLTMYRLRGLAS